MPIRNGRVYSPTSHDCASNRRPPCLPGRGQSRRRRPWHISTGSAGICRCDTRAHLARFRHTATLGSPSQLRLRLAGPDRMGAMNDQPARPANGAERHLPAESDGNSLAAPHSGEVRNWPRYLLALLAAQPSTREAAAGRPPMR